MPIQGLQNNVPNSDVSINRAASTQTLSRPSIEYQAIRDESPVTTTNYLSTQTDPADSEIPPPVGLGGDPEARHAWLEERVIRLEEVRDLAAERSDLLNELANSTDPETRTAARNVLRQLPLLERELSRDQAELDWLEAINTTNGLPRFMQPRTDTDIPNIPGAAAWPAAGSDAETLSGNRGVASGTGDVVLNNVSGDVAFRRSGTSLFVGGYEVQNAFNEEGQMVRRVYLRGGEVNQAFFSGMNESGIAAQHDSDGNIVGGINFSARSSSPSATSSAPFDSDSIWQRDAARSTDSEIVYSGDGAGTFQAPSSYRGQAVRAVEVAEDPSHPGDILVKLRSTPQGNVLVTYRLTSTTAGGAKALVEGMNLKFKGAENGQYWNASTLTLDWKGGDGNHNMIRARGGHLEAGNAGDYIKQEGSEECTIIGGSGNDILVGGNGNVTINGGDGNDFLYGGLREVADARKDLNGGLGNDVIIVAPDTGDENDAISNIEGGGGLDYSNATSTRVHNIQDDELAQLQQELVQWQNDYGEAPPRPTATSTTEERNRYNNYQTELNNMRNAISRASRSIQSGVLGIFRSKETEFQNFFSGGSDISSTTDTSWQHPSTTTPSGTGSDS